MARSPFTAQICGTVANRLVRPARAVEDFNRDGWVDLATANFDSNDISVVLGDGTGGFGAARSFAVGGQPSSLFAADLNHDGKLDLITNNGNIILTLLGDGSGAFGPATPFSAELPNLGDALTRLAIGDFDMDGNLDVAASMRHIRAVVMLPGDGRGGLGAPVSIPFDLFVSDVSFLATSDFNGDGHPDLALSSYKSEAVGVRLGNGKGGFGATLVSTSGVDARFMISGDFNRDGIPDLIALCWPPSPRVLLGDGSGVFLQQATDDFNAAYLHWVVPTSAVLGDFDADGNLDVIVGNDGSGMHLFFGSPPANFPPLRLPSSCLWARRLLPWQRRM